jgi:hypothetical protein
MCQPSNPLDGIRLAVCAVQRSVSSSSSSSFWVCFCVVQLLLDPMGRRTTTSQKEK